MTNRNPWGVLALLCIPVFIGSVDLTIVSAILPEVIVSLRLPVESRLDDAFWMITAYLLAYTISMVFVGRLSDLIGRRRVYLAFLVLFMFGSYWVAVAHTFPTELYGRVYSQLYPDTRPLAEELRTLHMIILGRVLQALGAGAMAPVTMAMVGDLFPAEKRARPIGVVGAIDTVGWMLGHLYGGVMVKFFGANGAAIVEFFAKFGISISEPTWRTLFWLNLITGTFTFIAVVVVLRGMRQERVREPFDFLGTGLIVLALIGLNLGLGSTNPESTGAFQNATPTRSGFALPLLALAGLAFLLFLLVEQRTRYPLIKLHLFRLPNVSVAALVNVAVGFCLTIGLVVMPILVNIREGEVTEAGIQQAALIAGLLLSALTVPMALAAVPGAFLSDRFGYRAATMTGLGLTAGGFLLMALSWQADTNYWMMGAQMTIAGVGMGLTISPIGAAVINAAAATERGAASAMVLALRLVGMTLALSSLTDFAINRVNRLAAERSLILDSTEGLYLLTTVDVVGELLVLGAGVGLVALVLASFMRGGVVSTPSANPPAPLSSGQS